MCMELKIINEEIKNVDCKKVNPYCKGNVGNNLVKSNIAIIGQQPSPFGNLKEPFTGKDKELFDLILKKLNLDRTKVFITNVVKCASFYISKDLIDFWKNYLVKELNIVKPKLIICLGKISSSFFIPDFSSEHYYKIINKLNYTLFCAHHPSYAIRNGIEEWYLNKFDLLSLYISKVNINYKGGEG